MDNDSIPDKKFSKYYNNLYIDINGPEKKPNILGQDLFTVLAEERGAVLPVGSDVYLTFNNKKNFGQNYGGDYLTNDLKYGSFSWRKACKPGEKPMKNGWANPGVACAGSIADNGWQVKYKW